MTLVKSVVILSLTLGILPAYAADIADSDNQRIPCVSVDVMQQSADKIDTAQKVNNLYLVYTATAAYQANNLWWFVGVGDISASSGDEAITSGQKILRATTVQESAYAIKEGNEFVCKYGPGDIEAHGKKLSLF